MSDSEDEQQRVRKPRGPNRFKFKTFSEQVNEVDVDVYRRVGRVRTAPLPGNTCFLQEGITHWRELNTASHWVAASTRLHDHCQSLAQLVHHKQAALGVLLGGLDPEAALSLPPFLDLLVALARDLQGDFLELLPEVLDRFVWFLSPEGAGGARDPAVLELLFQSLGGLCKALGKYLVAGLPQLLKVTAGLRYYPADHVRALAAETLGYLLRQAPDKALRAGVRALLGEVVVKPTMVRVHGAGLLLAESILTVNHGLHSRAPAVLQLMLAEDLLIPEDFAGAAGKKQRHKQQQQQQLAQGGAEEVAGEGTGLDGQQGPGRELLRERATAVAAVAMERVLDHLRRGSCSSIWEALHTCVTNRLAVAVSSATAAAGSATDGAAAAAAAAAAANGAGKAAHGSLQQQQQQQPAAVAEARAAVASCARGLQLFTQGVAFFRGSRVQDFTPILALCNQLVQQLPLLQRFDSFDQSTSITHAVLQLLVAVAHAHVKAVGASSGLSVISAAAPKWAPVFGLAPSAQLLPFIRGLLLPPGSPALAGIFSAQICGSLGQILMRGDSSSPAAGHRAADSQCQRSELTDQSLGLLLDCCQQLQPEAIIGSSLPLLMTAQPGGLQLAAHVKQLARSWFGSNADGDSCSRQHLLSAWAGLQLLPYACDRPGDAVAACEAVVAAVDGSTAAAAAAAAAGSAGQSAAGGSTVADVDLLQLRAAACAMLAQLLPHAAANQLPAVAAAALQAALHNPVHVASVEAAVKLLAAARSALTQSKLEPAAVQSARDLLSSSQLSAATSAMLPALLAPSRRICAAALQLLTSFDQPPYVVAPTAADVPGLSSATTGQTSTKTPAFAGVRCEVLTVLRDMHCQPCTLEHGRSWAAALDRIAGHLEYDRLPTDLVPTVVAGLISVCYIRFSPLWAPTAAALAMALTKHTAVAWPLLLAQLTSAQEQLLTGQRQVDPQQVSTSTSSGGGGAPAVAAHQGGSQESSLGTSLEEKWAHLQVAADIMASGGCTDAANRSSWFIKAAAGVANHDIQHQLALDWVPLLLTCAELGGVKAGGALQPDAAEDDEEDQEEADGQLPVGQTGQTTPVGQQGVSSAKGAVKLGSKRKSSQLDLDAAPGVDQEGGQTPLTTPLTKKQAVEGAGASSGKPVAAKPRAAAPRQMAAAGGKAWRSVMTAWLQLLATVKGVRGLPRVKELQAAVASQLLTVDQPLQIAALKCLRPFKLSYLPSDMLDKLVRLADVRTLREELVGYPLGPGAEGGMLEEQRPGLVPLVISVLYPKMRKRSGRLAGKGAPGSARAAVLNALAALRPAELRPLLELLLQPISVAFRPEYVQQASNLAKDGTTNASGHSGSSTARGLEAELAVADACRLVAPPAWSAALLSRPLEWWLEAVDESSLSQLPLRLRIGFLNTFEDLLQHLGYQLQPLLPPLLAVAMKLLASACSGLPSRSAADATTIASAAAASPAASTAAAAAGVEDDSKEASREVRATSLKLFAQVWTRFPAATDFNPLWPHFFAATAPLLPRLQPEAVAAAPPPLLQCVVALAASPGLVRVLGNLPTRQELSPDDDDDRPGAPQPMQVDAPAAAPATNRQDFDWPAGSTPNWAVQNAGGQLLCSCITMLTTKGCSDATRDAVLQLLEALLRLPDQQLLQQVLLPWSGLLLQALRASVNQVLSAATAAGRGPKGVKAKRRPSVLRQLALMEAMGAHVTDAATAADLADALVSLLAPGSVGTGKKGLDEASAARALGALGALWQAQHAQHGGQQQQVGQPMAVDRGDQGGQSAAAAEPTAAMQHHWEVLSQLTGKLRRRDARSAMATALLQLSHLLTQQGQQYSTAAAALVDLNSWVEGTLDEVDYDRRLKAYSRLTADSWSNFSRPQALPVVLQCFHDLRNAEDLALRQSAASALTNCVSALTELDWAPAAAAAEEEDTNALLRLLPRVLYPQCRLGLRSNSSAVRQEHLSMLRTIVMQLPGRFPDLVCLTSPNPDRDFLLNIAHLQVHRRGRALLQLARQLQQQQPEEEDGEDDQGVQQQAEEEGGVAQEQQQQQADGDHMDTDGQQQQQRRQEGAPGPPSSAAAAGAPSVRLLVDVIRPLLQQVIVEAGAGDSERAHERKQAELDRETNVVDAAVRCLGAVAGRLSWPQYSALLHQWLRLMTQRTSKPTVRAVCAVLDAFHFKLPGQLLVADVTPKAAAAKATAAEADEQQQEEEVHDEVDQEDDHEVAQLLEEPEADPREEEEAAAAAAAALDLTAQQAVAADMQRVLLHNVLPALHDQLVVEDEGQARAPVAVALVKLLKLLPPEVERIELPRATQSIAGLLRSRAQGVRDDARAVLVEMTMELGAPYLPYICNVLQAVLPDKGFTAHVTGFTLTAVLAALDKAGMGPGALDSSLHLVVPLLEADLFGQISEAKAVTAFSGQYKETKRCRAYEAYQILAGNITFNTNMDALLQPVLQRLPAATAPTLRNKLALLLQAASRGVAVNPTATSVDLAVWVDRTLDRCLSVEEAARAAAKAAVGAALSVKPAVKPARDSWAAEREPSDAIAEAAASPGAAHLYLVTEFTLNLLSAAVKKGVLSGRSPDTLGLLEPLVPHLIRALGCRHPGSVAVALRLLTTVVNLPLTSLATAAAAAGKAVTKLLQQVPDAGHPVAQDCFRLLAGLLRGCPEFSPSNAQIRFLLKWLTTDLTSNTTAATAAGAAVGALGGGSSVAGGGERQAGIGLLRAILGRKVLVPEVYDAMNQVQQVMVRSHSDPTRRVCSAALLQFLLDYPLGPARLAGHLQFLVTNVGYEYEAGRLQALDMLQQVIMKFPVEVVAEYSQVLYIPLVARLANETSPQARAAVTATVKLLHSTVDTDTNDALFDCISKWLGGSNAAMRRAAAQALATLADAEGSAKFARRFTVDFLGQLVDRLTSAAAAADGGAVEVQADATEGPAGAAGGVSAWQEAYHLLLLFERAVAGGLGPLQWQQEQQQQPAAALVSRLWLTIVQLLLHPHLWVRKAAARLVGCILADAAAAGSMLAGQTSGLTAGALALQLYRQLEADVVDEGLCQQAVKCLVAVARIMATQQQQQQEVAQDGAEPPPKAAAAAAGTGTAAPKQQANGVHTNGHHAADSGSDDDDAEEEEEQLPGPASAEEEEEQPEGDADEGSDELDADSDQDQDELSEDEQGGEPGATAGSTGIRFQGLLVRMVRLAEDTKVRRQLQRMAGLRFIAAAASSLATAVLLPHLALLVRPLFRISEAAAGGGAGGGAVLPVEVKEMGEQVLEHLRNTFGTEPLLAAYTAARESVRGARSERKKLAARKVMLDPEAVAKSRLKKNARKAEGRRVKLEERRRLRTARSSGGFISKRSGAPRGRGGRRGGGGGRGGSRGGRGRR